MQICSSIALSSVVSMCFMTEGMVKMVKGKMVKAGGFQPGQTVALITTLWCA